MTTTVTSSALIKIHGVSDIGKVRKLNEDKFSISNLSVKDSLNTYQGEVSKDGCLMLVCDGSGGDGRGEIAAKLAVDIFQKEIFTNEQEEIGIGARLINAANKANEVIWKCSKSNPSIAGMASTLTAALVVPPQVYIVEVGDSRCYLVRDGAITQVTRDQSMVQMLIDGGVITPHTAKIHPYRNIVLQSLGARVSVVPVITSLELAQKDRLLLCSDGLSKNLPEEKMLEIIVNQEDVVIASQQLIAAANDLIADDNVTAILAMIEGDAFAKAEKAATLLLSETADGDLSEELEDLTSELSLIDEDIIN